MSAAVARQALIDLAKEWDDCCDTIEKVCADPGHMGEAKAMRTCAKELRELAAQLALAPKTALSYFADDVEAAMAQESAAEPVVYANPVILIHDEDEGEWTAKVQSDRDDVFSLPLYAAPPQQWHPIATAPKDGQCLVWCETADGGEVMKLYRDAKGNWLYEGEPTCSTGFYIEPTYWMPLPPAPNQGEAS